MPKVSWIKCGFFLSSIFFLASIAILFDCSASSATTAYGWARGWYGQLGPLGSEKTFSPVTIPLPQDIISIKVGSTFGLALDASGRVWAWGRGMTGVTGRESPPANREENYPDPSIVPGLPEDIVEIAAGEEVAFALSKDGTVWTWGGSNTFGDQGYGNSVQSSVPPKKVPGLANIIRISAVSYHGLALRSDGTVWSWGHNSFGECGVDPEVQSSHITPRQVQGLSNIIAIETGYSTSFALRVDGVMFGWGADVSPVTYQYDPLALSGETPMAQLWAASFNGYAEDIYGQLWSIGQHGGGCLNANPQCESTTTLQRATKVPSARIMEAGHTVAIFCTPQGTLKALGSNLYGGLALEDPYAQAWDPIDIPNISNVFDVDANENTVMVLTGAKCHAQLDSGLSTLFVPKVNVLGRAYSLKFVSWPVEGYSLGFKLVSAVEVPVGACGQEATLLNLGGEVLLHLPWIEFEGRYFWANMRIIPSGDGIYGVIVGAGEL